VSHNLVGKISHIFKIHPVLKLNVSLFFDIEFFKYFFRVLHEASSSWLKLFVYFDYTLYIGFLQVGELNDNKNRLLLFPFLIFDISTFFFNSNSDFIAWKYVRLR
jgi:hypothetical protein